MAVRGNNTGQSVLKAKCAIDSGITDKFQEEKKSIGKN